MSDPDHYRALELLNQLQAELAKMKIDTAAGTTHSVSDVFRRYYDACRGSILNHQEWWERENGHKHSFSDWHRDTVNNWWVRECRYRDCDTRQITSVDPTKPRSPFDKAMDQLAGIDHE